VFPVPENMSFLHPAPSNSTQRFWKPKKKKKEKKGPHLLPAVLMTPTVFSGLLPVLALKMTETASFWAR
jgi:hypothetical protein